MGDYYTHKHKGWNYSIKLKLNYAICLFWLELINPEDRDLLAGCE